MSETETAVEILQQIREAESNCQRTMVMVENAKEVLKDAKSKYDASVATLRDLCRANGESMPLFESANDDGDGDDWKDTTTIELGLSDSVCALLAEANIETIGDIAEWTKRRQLTDIKGIGEQKANDIDNAIMNYWTKTPTNSTT